MAVKASAAITLSTIRDIQSVTWYYLLQPSAAAAPAKPTTLTPPTITTQGYSGWSDTEPSYTAGDTRSLYVTERTVYTDGTFEYTTPSLSSSYEAAKQAYNEAQNAKKVATNFMSADSMGVMVADLRNGSGQTPSDPSGRNVLIDSDSVDIRNGRDVLASFGSTAVIGQEGESQVQIDYNSLQMIDKEGNTFFIVSDLRDRSGVATVEESFVRYNTTMLTFRAIEIVDVIADGTTLSNTDYSLGPNGQDVTINVSYEEVIITYTTNRIVTAYTLGDRLNNRRVGANSVAMGRLLIASGPFAVALGSNTEAGGRSSLASGVHTKALGNNSAAFGSTGIATGFGSAAFGYGGNANGMFSFVDGEDNVANGRNSHAMGRGTIAQQESQTVMGRYNEADSRNKNALIIGNGASDSDRSNAFSVDWDGCVEVSGHPDNTSWCLQREFAAIKRNRKISDTGMHPFFDVLTQLGDWAFATYGENTWLSYITNDNYESGTNTQSAYFRFNSNGSFAPSGKYMSGTKSLFVLDTMSIDNQTIAKSATSSISFSIAKAGYTPIAIRGFDIDNASSSGANVGNCVVLAAKIKDASTAEFQIRNTATTAAKLKLWLYVTYIATAAL